MLSSMRHCLKSIQIRSFLWSVFSCIRTEYRKIRSRNNSVFSEIRGFYQDLLNLFHTKPYIINSWIDFWVKKVWKWLRTARSVLLRQIFILGKHFSTTLKHFFANMCKESPKNLNLDKKNWSSQKCVSLTHLI